MGWNLDFQYVLWGNTIEKYIVALAIFIASILLLHLFKFVILLKLKNIALKTETIYDDLVVNVVDSIGWPFYMVLSIFIASRFLILPDLARKILIYVIIIVAVFYAVKAISTLIDYAISILVQTRGGDGSSSLKVIGNIAKAIVWIMALLALLQNFGVNVSALIAGFGIAGIAVGFAMQNILSDIFASIVIYLDKPFQEGDLITIGADTGIIKHIGVRSTRIQTLEGQELIVSNREMTSIRINNYNLMHRRRAVFSFNVASDTPLEKLQLIPKIVADAVNSVAKAKIARANFKSLGPSLNYEIAYYIDDNDYTTYMDVQQQINLKLKEELDKNGIKVV